MKLFKHICREKCHLHQVQQLPIIEQRLLENKYISYAAKRMDEEFVKRVTSQEEILQWADEHYDMFTNVNGKVVMTIKVPHLNDILQKFEIKECKLEIVRCNDGHHWIFPSYDFRGRRLDWQTDIFLDILKHQDDMEQWCEEYTQSYRLTERYWDKSLK